MPKALWLLIIGLFICMTGSSFLWPLNAIYLHDHLGKTLSIAGFVLMLNAGTNVIGSLIGGVLYDKIGGYRSILLGIVITIAALSGLSIWHGWPHYMFFMGITGFGSGIIFPSIYALAGFVWREGGRKAFNALYVAHNAGVALGSALGGLIASYTFDYIFLANLFMYIVFLFIALFGYKNITSTQPSQSKLLQQEKLQSIHKIYTLMILCGAFFLCWVAYVQWFSTISAYTQMINISLKQYSLLWTINGVLIVIAQPLLQWLLRKYNDHLKGQILVGIGIFIISFGVVGISSDFKGFVAAMIILTIGEMLVWPVVPTVANQLAPLGREGIYQGVVNSTGTAGRMIGPVLGGILVDLYGMNILFAVLIGLLVIAILMACAYDIPLKVKKGKNVSAQL